MPLLSQIDAETALQASLNRMAMPMPSSYEAGFLWSQYKAAEADASRQLRVLFEPTQIFAGDPTDDEIAALTTVSDGPEPVTTTVPHLVEAAYDYEPDMFQNDKWGFIVTRQKPIIAVQSIQMVFPAVASHPFDIAADWIRMDRKYGQIRIVPTGASMATPIAMHLMQIIGGGRSVPHMVRIRYTAGLTDAVNNYPDLLDVIKKMALLRIIDGMFFPQSGSISADGLSQSTSVDTQKLHDGIDDKLDALRDAIHGIRCMFV
jgi:hypothetical protein